MWSGLTCDWMAASLQKCSQGRQAQQNSGLPPRPDHLSLISRAHRKVEGEKRIHKVALSPWGLPPTFCTRLPHCANKSIIAIV